MAVKTFTVNFCNWFQKFPEGGMVDNNSWDAFQFKENVEARISEVIERDQQKVYRITARDGRMFDCTEADMGIVIDGEIWVLIEVDPGINGGAIFRRMSNQKLISFYDVRGLTRD